MEEERTDYSNLPNYTSTVNKIISAEARDSLLKTDKENLINAKEKLEHFLPGTHISIISQEIEKVQVIADTLAALGKRVEKELTKRAKQRKKLLEQKEHEAKFVAELEKADAIADVFGFLGQKFEEEITKKEIKEQAAIDPEVEKVRAIADVFAALRERVDKEVERKAQKHIKVLKEKKSETDKPTSAMARAITETMTDLKGKVEDEIKKREDKGMLQDKKISEMVKSIICSEVEKMEEIADIVTTLGEEVGQTVTESLVDFQIEKILAISDVLATIGERVEHAIFVKLGVPVETVKEICEILAFLKEEFDKGIGRRAFAFQIDLNGIILRLLDSFYNEIDITYPAFEALISMSKDLPEILNKNGLSVAMFFFHYSPVAATRQQLMRWLQICMTDCEENRSKLYYEGIMTYLTMLIEDDTTTSPVIHEVCLTIRALAEYEHCHNPTEAIQRIDEIAYSILARLTYFLRKFVDNKTLLINVLITIRKLLVKSYLSEILVYVGKGKALLYLYDVFINHCEEEELISEMLCLFAVMVHNDIAKSTMMEAGVAYIIKFAMDTHQNSAKVTEASLQCVAQISLRCPYNTALFIDFGFPARILKGMEIHSRNYLIQKIGSWIIRLFITYRYDIMSFLISLGALDVLYDAMNIHKFKCEFDAKAALRDLEEHTDLFEPISKPDADIEFPL